MYLDGVSYAGIAKVLNHEGIPTPRARTIEKAVTKLNALLAKNPKVGRGALHRLFKDSPLMAQV